VASLGQLIGLRSSRCYWHREVDSEPQL